MADTLEHPLVDLVAWGKALRKARVDAELSLAQAAAALGNSPTTLDAWEQGRKPQISVDDAERLYKAYSKNTQLCWSSGDNYLFGAFPLRVARDILALDVAGIAGRLGYSPSSWTKMEANARVLPKPKLEELEGLVLKAWSDACARADLRH